MTRHPAPHSSPEHSGRQTRSGWRRLQRPVVLGALAGVAMWVIIVTLRPAMFVDRQDLVVEQCLKTGLAVFAFSLLLVQLREGDTGK